MYFEIKREAITHLKKVDPQLKEAINRIGTIKRPVNNDLYLSLLFNIIGQQISTSAHQTIWQRLITIVKDVTPQTIMLLDDEQLQKIGISFRKVSYIKNITAHVIANPSFISELEFMSDQEIIARLITLKGIGVWTAEMLLIFSLQRPDVLSYNDLAIHRGMRVLYNKDNIDKAFFEQCRLKYSPYGSTASLYLWALAKEEN
ncbi:MAG: DNA-3-methyladenine glycosylase 2 family protein [Erysipelotrichaceae bacterium]|nr:DNA-3-methyladenine glycosylase 2 family protein [Erysipelotrichaceae bacterium]